MSGAPTSPHSVNLAHESAWGRHLALDVASERGQKTGHRVLRDLTGVLRNLGRLRLGDNRLGVLDPLLETFQVIGKEGVLDFLETLVDLVGEEVFLLRVEELGGLNLQLLGSGSVTLIWTKK